MEAVSLYSGAWLRPVWLGLFIPLLIMGITDWLLGWHSLWPFTWSATLIGVLLGRWLLRTQAYLPIAGTALLQATLFFLITNFGVWVQGFYGYTLSGLAACYVAALPFYHYQVLGALTYGTLLWVVEYTFLRRLQAVRG